MKKLLYFFGGILCLFITQAYGNGVAIVDAANEHYLDLTSSFAIVSINNQVATVKTTQHFKNTTGGNSIVKYAYPLPEGAGAIKLRWKFEGSWFTADISPSPQDTTLPGTNNNPTASDLTSFIGNTPLFFNIIQNVKADSSLTVELTYVQLLPYFNNVVDLNLANDYSLIQNSLALDTQSLTINIVSDRTIDFINMISHQNAIVTTSLNSGSVNFMALSQTASMDYVMEYSLASDELGLYSFSTFYNSGVQCDANGGGYFGLMVEPDPSDTADVIEKDFILVIDKSGSMGGNKITQARDAASFIVNNLNAGDRFNIVSFNNGTSMFKSGLVDYNLTNQSAALNYISSLSAGGGTNINDALIQSIPQFASSAANDAKIILFFTDGNGSNPTPTVLANVSNQVNYYVPDINIFTFGIGTNVNQPLLSQLASQNNGIYTLLTSANLLSTISTFYLTIQSPVLLNTAMTFSPPALFEMYPRPLPNLYKGQQLVVLGRYPVADSVNAIFSGSAFGNPVSYSYDFSLADTIIPDNGFLPKLWAQQKIKYLMSVYYSSGSGSYADSIENEVINLSICYQVSSPFTSFTGNIPPNLGGPNAPVGEFYIDEPAKQAINIYPNPCSNFVFVKANGLLKVGDQVEIEIFDAEGRLLIKLKQSIRQVEQPIKINISQLERGNYVLVLKTNNIEHRGIITKM